MNNRNVFLSFLGTSPYLDCIYKDKEGNHAEATPYIQKALIDLYCRDWTENDAIYIFLTKDAEEKNWTNKLETVLSNKTTKAQIKPIFNLPEGKNEEEIWEIFNIVYEQLTVIKDEDEDEDEDVRGDNIIYDITHSFRSLPMLGMTLLNYAKFTKKISVSRICYGAFEVLGHPPVVKNIPIEERIAPIFDLSQFSVLQDWTSAAEGLIKYGSVDQLSSHAVQEKNKFFQTPMEKDASREFGIMLDKIGGGLKMLGTITQTVDAPKIYEGKTAKRLLDSITAIINKYSSDSKFIKPLSEILQQVKSKIDPFSKENQLENLDEIIKFYLKHNMYIEAVALLREWPISAVLEIYGLPIEEYKLREAFRPISRLPEIKYNPVKIKEIGEDVKKIHEDKDSAALQILDEIVSDYEKHGDESIWYKFLQNYDTVLKIRNNMMHCGYSSNDANFKIKKVMEIHGNFSKFLKDLKEKRKLVGEG